MKTYLRIENSLSRMTLGVYYFKLDENNEFYMNKENKWVKCSFGEIAEPFIELPYNTEVQYLSNKENNNALIDEIKKAKNDHTKDLKEIISLLIKK